MTTTNINKIVRGNVSLKPWILSKNTSEIVNACVQKIYKQLPKAFKNDQPTKIAEPKPENKAPIRSLRSQERLRALNGGGQSPRNGLRSIEVNERLINYIINNNKKSAIANLVGNKKLLKSPNFKIYGSRRFGSSASSSSASLLRRPEDRRNQTRVHNTANYLLRSFVTNPSHASGGSSFGLNAALTKYLVPARNQHMESRVAKMPNAIKVSSSIQRDLMLVDSGVKERISLARNKDPKPQIEPKSVDPMEGWHHPPPPDLFMSRLNERGIANAELQEQHRRLKIAHKMKPFDTRTIEVKPVSLASIGNRISQARMADPYSSINKELSPRMTQHTHGLKKSVSMERVSTTHRFMGRKPTERRSESVSPPLSKAPLPGAPSTAIAMQPPAQAQPVPSVPKTMPHAKQNTGQAKVSAPVKPGPTAAKANSPRKISPNMPSATKTFAAKGTAMLKVQSAPAAAAKPVDKQPVPKKSGSNAKGGTSNPVTATSTATSAVAAAAAAAAVNNSPRSGPASTSTNLSRFNRTSYYNPIKKF